MFRSYFRRRDGYSLRRRAQSYAYTPLQIAAAYGIPLTYYGKGQTVGIIELGGAFSQNDLDAYLKSLGQPAVRPTVIGAQNQQNDPSGANVEVMMDVEIVAAIAPQAIIRVYFAQNTDTDFVAAVAQAVAECDVVSISWGGPESNWSAASRAEMDGAIQQGSVNGANVYVAAGDNGSSDGGSGKNVDYPASSPYAIGCGGTRLVIQNGIITSETVWNDGSLGGSTGGGYSIYYPMPSYQQGLANGSMRGVPDVAGVADPETGWLIQADGVLGVIGGTSAVAPMWAAINALMNEKAGRRVGWGDPLYYANPGAFYDTVTGSNGAYNAGPGWDACTGMGTPKGVALFSLAGGQPIPVPPPPVPVPPLPPPPPVIGPPKFLASLDVNQQVIKEIPYHHLIGLILGL